MKLRLLFFVIIISIMVFALLSGCKRDDLGSQPNDLTTAEKTIDTPVPPTGEIVQKESAKSMPSIVPKPAPKGDKIPESGPLAKVNGKVIKVEDIKDEVEAMKKVLKGIPPQEAEKIKKQILESTIHFTIMQEETEKLGIKITAQEIASKMGEIMRDQNYKKFAAQMGQSEDYLKKMVSKTLLMEKLFSRVFNTNFQVTDKHINDYYQKNKEEFKRQPKVKASHILLKVAPEDDEKTKQGKLTKLKSVLEKIKKGGDFVAMAKKHSQCPSSASGGDLGEFTKDMMVKEFSEIVFNMKKGQVSEVFKTQFGYHIAKVTGIITAGYSTLDEVKQFIKNKILSQRVKPEKIKEYMDKLLKSAQIEYLF